MHLLPIRTPLLKEDDNLASVLVECAESKEAEALAHKSGQTPAMRQAMLNEVERMHGRVVGTCPHAVLTELKPEGLASGSIMAASAGVDHSNAPEGYVIGWPADPRASMHRLRAALKEETGKDVAVALSDSCCRPRRIGITAIALAVSGFDPIADERGKKDLFGKELTMTQEARADQLATAANMLMGNADGSTPAVIIRDHGIPFSNFEGWVPGIEPEEDIFHGMI